MLQALILRVCFAVHRSMMYYEYDQKTAAQFRWFLETCLGWFGDKPAACCGTEASSCSKILLITL